MAVMVRINREIAQEPWISQTFGEENARQIVTMIKGQEDDSLTAPLRDYPSSAAAPPSGVANSSRYFSPISTLVANFGSVSPPFFGL